MSVNLPCLRGAAATFTLEWVLRAVLIIGTVGVAAVRNALILEYQDMIETICEMSVAD
jgi:hypothetical protein